MPNWCHNYLVVECDDKQKLQDLAEAFNKQKMLEHIIPFPEGKWDYEFCIQNWGTKWDINTNDFVDPKSDPLILHFSTAWSPPIGVYKKMIELGFKIDAMFDEPGLAFAGRFSNSKDEYFEYVDKDPEWIKNNLGEIDEQFDISGSRLIDGLVDEFEKMFGEIDDQIADNSKGNDPLT
jgi:hypothetical protein